MRMPWAWKCGPSYASERHHFQELLRTQQFPDKTLFCGDAGFVGYDLWRAMADQGHHLAPLDRQIDLLESPMRIEKLFLSVGMGGDR